MSKGKKKTDEGSTNDREDRRVFRLSSRMGKLLDVLAEREDTQTVDQVRAACRARLEQNGLWPKPFDFTGLTPEERHLILGFLKKHDLIESDPSE